MSKSAPILPGDYAAWLASLKQRITGARHRAILAANEEQIRLYHEIGREILDRQSRQGWGAKVIDRLSADLRAEFPDMKGLSSSNLKYMRFFAQECPERQIGQQSADPLPWFHIVTLLTQISDPFVREWYARETIQQAWSRDTHVADGEVGGRAVSDSTVPRPAPASVPQVSKPAVSPASQPAGPTIRRAAGIIRTRRRFGNLRYGRFGNLRYNRRLGVSLGLTRIGCPACGIADCPVGSTAVCRTEVRFLSRALRRSYRPQVRQPAKQQAQTSRSAAFINNEAVKLEATAQQHDRGRQHLIPQQRGAGRLGD